MITFKEYFEKRLDEATFKANAFRTLLGDKNYIFPRTDGPQNKKMFLDDFIKKITKTDDVDQQKTVIRNLIKQYRNDPHVSDALTNAIWKHITNAESEQKKSATSAAYQGIGSDGTHRGNDDWRNKYRTKPPAEKRPLQTYTS